MKPIEPNFKTPEKDLCKEELNKLNSHFIRGTLKEDFRDMSIESIVWESEQLAKSHGIYLEFNRAKSGEEKDWMYMIRITIPGGGPITPKQWKILDEISDAYTVNPEGQPSLRLTTRQNIQYHWIKHQHMVEMVNKIATTGFYTLNGCGDNVRNVMATPRSYTSKIFNGNALAQKLGEYFRLPADPHIQIFAIDPNYIRTPDEHFNYGQRLLNRKFKIGISGVEWDEAQSKYVYDNSVELLTNDMGIAPIVEDGKVSRYQVYIGGGQGERNGKPTAAMLAKPFGIFKEADLLFGLDAILKVHQEWGDRQNRFWSRIKYVVHKLGIPWYQEQVRALGAKFEAPDPHFDYGSRQLYYGWYQQPSNGLWSYGTFIECGRLIDDSPNGNLKSMAKHMMASYPIKTIITPNQDLLFVDIPEASKKAFEMDLLRFGYGKRNGKEYSTLRKSAVACVGLYTCRLSYTESEQYLPVLIDELEKRGYADYAESIGISGCERQCSRPATKVIGLVGGGKNLYKLKLLGTEDARHQGEPLTDASGEEMYLSTVSRDEVPELISVLFDYFKSEKKPGETMGYFFRRIGMAGMIAYLKQNSKTASMMEKTRKIG